MSYSLEGGFCESRAAADPWRLRCSPQDAIFCEDNQASSICAQRVPLSVGNRRGMPGCAVDIGCDFDPSERAASASRTTLHRLRRATRLTCSRSAPQTLCGRAPVRHSASKRSCPALQRCPAALSQRPDARLRRLVACRSDSRPAAQPQNLAMDCEAPSSAAVRTGNSLLHCVGSYTPCSSHHCPKIHLEVKSSSELPSLPRLEAQSCAVPGEPADVWSWLHS